MKRLHGDPEFNLPNPSVREGARSQVGLYVFGYENAPDAPPVSVGAEHPENKGQGAEKHGGSLGNIGLMGVNSQRGIQGQMYAEETSCYILKPAKDGQPERAFIQPLVTEEKVPGVKTAAAFGEPVEIPVERLEQVIGKENLQQIRREMGYDREPDQGPER